MPKNSIRQTPGSRVAQLSGLRRVSSIADFLVIGLLTTLYLISFDSSSAVNGPHEVFGQDSKYIIEFVFERQPYLFNPQNHVLYHVVVESGYSIWNLLFTHSAESVYRYLKLFTALTGLGFLLALRLLLRDLGLALTPRAILIALAGLSVSSWFHFSAFETHALAMPALTLYLVALQRLLRQKSWTLGNRLLLIGSLVLCGWTRVDLWRFALMTTPLLALPALRGFRRILALDLAVVVLVGAVGNIWLVHRYLDVPLDETPARVMQRYGRPDIEAFLMRKENVTPHYLVQVGRAISVYSILMPVKRPDEVRYFYEPVTTQVQHPFSLLALVGVIALLASAAVSSVRRIIRGDTFHVAIALQWIAGWILYTWFNPHEPFLWILEFLILQIAVVADTSRDRTRWYWGGLALLAALVGLHNWRFFYLVFS